MAPPAAHSFSEHDIQAWRTAQIDARQVELATIVDRHDDHVRELFHLDRFVTLIGFDPVAAKADKSDVFLTFQHNFDLWTNATPEATGAGGGRRATRRAATERKVGVLPQPEQPPAPVASTSTAGSRVGMGHPHGKVDHKGKGKAIRAVEVPQPPTDDSGADVVVIQRGGKGKGKSRAKGRKSAPPAVPSPQAGPSTLSPAPRSKRQSLAISTLRPDNDTLPSPTASTSSHSFLKHSLPTPSAPTSSKRLKVTHETPPTYSHPSQLPPIPPHGGSLSTLLSSYINIDEDSHPLPLPPSLSLSLRASHEASILTRVAALRVSVRTLGNPDRRPSNEPKREKDHQDHLTDQVIYFSKLLGEERRQHVAMGRRIGKMVLAHFAGLKGKEERVAKEVEKGQKALAKWTAREVRKKWKMAVNVVKARRKLEQKAERDRIGKEQLNAMLDKSTTILQAQQVEMAAEDSESEADSESSEEEEEEEEEEEPAGEDDAATPADEDEGASVGSPAPRQHLSRSRSALSVPADSPSVVPETEEEDDDVVFEAPEDTDRLQEDDAWEAEMEEEEDEEDGDEDSELGGLAEDAELSIEELMRRSGYGDLVDDADPPEPTEGEGEDVEMAEASFLVSNDEPTPLPATDEPTPSEPQVDEPTPSEPQLEAIPSDPAPSEPLPPISTSPAPSSPTHLPPPALPIPSAEDPTLTAEEREAEAMSEFGGSGSDGARDDEDEQFAEEMEADESEDDDGEMDGLVEDADLPIEELMAKYGYGAPAQEGEPPVVGEGGEALVEVEEEGEPNGVEVEEEEGSLPAANGMLGDDVASGDEGSPKVEEEGSEEEASAEEEEEEEDEVDETIVAERPNLRPPFLLRGSLRPYQQAGLEWLASLYANGVNGILADEMGLGKTIQTISLLAHLACDKGQWGPHLVVVPTSVMLNWEMEFKKFLPGFKILTYYGNGKERKEKRKGWNTENSFHVCVTSYQLVIADQNMFRRKPWHYMILDEAHHIKNFRSQRWQTLLGFNARHRLLITGTPLQNNLMELWSLLYFLMPQGLTGEGGKGPFADHADFQAWFSNPMEKAIENGEAMDEETKATVSKLHTVLRPYLLRRLKSEVETQMPGKTESIIYCRLSKRQRFLYDDFMSRSQTRETLGSGHFLSIINCLMQLRKVCNHPDLFEVRPIVTSFAMSRSVASQYEPTELLVRKRLLDEAPMSKIDWSTLTLIKPDLEESASSVAARSRIRLDASPVLQTLHDVPIDFDLAVVPPQDTQAIAGWRAFQAWSRHSSIVARLASMATINSRRCASAVPFFGHELLHMLSKPSRRHKALLPEDVPRNPRASLESPTLLPRLVKSYVTRGAEADDAVAHFGFVTPKVKALDMARHALSGLSLAAVQRFEAAAPVDILQRASAKLSVAFPDRSLLQYDCGKLQKLDELLRECKAGGHRVLIFTQMTKVLDILEIFLSFHGHRYLRLDGSTKIEQRQIITERFNSNDNILCFISSTRSGGLGINLQGADTVIFYDSDWNPALDRQCQDRAHRIGQTREVRIWRFVTEHSIEENMLKKANQKRRLDEMVIAEGDFTTDYLQKLDWRDYLDENQLKELGVDEADAAGGAVQSDAEVRQALAAAEDEEDAAAAKAAEGELEVDRSDFSELAPVPAANAGGATGSGAPTPVAGGPSGEGSATPMEVEVVEEEGEVDPLAGTVDGYMVEFVTSNWASFDQ